MRRLLAFLHDAIAQQEPHVRDQLDAAVRDGDTRLRFEPSAVGVVVVVSVAGVDLAEVDVRHLVDLQPSVRAALRASRRYRGDYHAGAPSCSRRSTSPQGTPLHLNGNAASPGE